MISTSRAQKGVEMKRKGDDEWKSYTSGFEVRKNCRNSTFL
jgi:uncharacterized protein YaiE (UPF0345 family)